ncbi:hypothetical protein ACU82A_32200 [Bacillus cereus]
MGTSFSRKKELKKQHNNDEETVEQIVSDAEKKVYTVELDRFKNNNYTSFEMSQNEYNYIQSNNLSLFDSNIILNNESLELNQ